MANRTWMRRLSLGTCGLLALSAIAQAQSSNAQGAVSATVTIHADQPGAGHQSATSTASSPSISAPASMKASGSARSRRSPTPAAIATTWSRRSKALHVPVVRWPGGCFADEYHWRDGIGPRAKRPVKVNTHWGGVAETNEFGTHEFMAFAELIGAEVYISGNVGSGCPQEMADWMEYMTSDTVSTLANERRKNGRDKPWEVHLLRHRQRDLGLRRQHAARVLRRPVPPVRHLREGAARTCGRRSSPAAAMTTARNGSKC